METPDTNTEQSANDQQSAGVLPPVGAVPDAGVQPPEEQKLTVIMNIAVIFLFFVSPLIGFLIATKDQTFLKEQSRLALNGTITYAIFLFASFVLSVTVILSIIGIPLMGLALVLTLYGGIKGGVESSHGRFYRYPLGLNLLR
ncbi:MAG: DUF4870 domain-containing protein [Acidithiobacillus sp.]|jgi:uncharacterized Tic20 family protein|nr:DUF4870 domain-containing protein [Acidithiobacillus sp.]